MASMQVLADTETLATWLAERRERGLDRHDYIDEGRYVVAPMAGGLHQRAQMRLAQLLAPSAEQRGLECFAGANIGTENNYRVPDIVITEPGNLVFYPSARLVVEVLSPSEAPLVKLEHYTQCLVEEYLEVDPQSRTVRLLARRASGAEVANIEAVAVGVRWASADRSEVLGLNVADMLTALGWQ